MKYEILAKKTKTRKLKKTKKTTTKMGGLCEKRSKKGRGGRKVERKKSGEERPTVMTYREREKNRTRCGQPFYKHVKRSNMCLM